MTEKMKVIQPFRSPGDYAAFLEGVKCTAALFGLKVDCVAWGGGIPTELTLYEAKPEPVVTAEIDPDEEEDADENGTEAEHGPRDNDEPA